MEQKIKKFMNFRFALFVAFAMIVSIILASCLFVSQNSRLIVIVLLSIFIVVTLINFAIFKKKFLIFLAVIILMMILPFAMIYSKAKAINENNSIISDRCTYSGKICSLSKRLDDNVIIIELSSVEIISDEQKKDFYGNVYVRLYSNGVDTSKLAIGNIVTIYNSELKGLTLNEGVSEIERSFISRGITATEFAFSYNLRVDENSSMNLRDKIKSSIYTRFEKTDTFFTGVGYAMIFGETSVLHEDVYDLFKRSGIAHLLAVSGFHVSVIVAFLSFVLNKFKTNKYLKMTIIGVLLFAYAYLCSFSVSVIRASLMALLLMHSSNRNKEYDKLSSLSLVAILILLISPLQLFNLSFIFSFVSVLSIILLAPIFERLFSRIVYDKLSSLISISLAVCLGMSIFQLYYFGEIPIFSVVANIITIPLVSILFVFLIISILVGLLFNILVPLINVFGFCMKFIVQINGLISNNGLFIRSGKFAEISLLLSLVLMFIVSDYVFVKKKTKLIISIPLLALIIVTMI